MGEELMGLDEIEAIYLDSQIDRLVATARAAHRLQEEVAKLKAENEALRKQWNESLNIASTQFREMSQDAERLDYVLENSAFLMVEKLETGVLTYQLWSQDSDENYIYLSGENEFFNSPRRAIDAAMKKGGEDA